MLFINKYSLQKFKIKIEKSIFIILSIIYKFNIKFIL